jgi:hypothetical protein
LMSASLNPNPAANLEIGMVLSLDSGSSFSVSLAQSIQGFFAPEFHDDCRTWAPDRGIQVHEDIFSIVHTRLGVVLNVLCREESDARDEQRIRGMTVHGNKVLKFEKLEILGCMKLYHNWIRYIHFITIS